jgi:gamma-glutamylcyclotransferase (GGCT)/AIG2-like uncharacterized protein YtfP
MVLVDSYSLRLVLAVQKGMDVFVYGSLMFPAVYEGVTGVARPMIDALLHSYRRYGIQNPQGSSYPGIVPEEGSVVRGKVIRGITEQELSALDSFEDVEHGLYRRQEVEVFVQSGALRAVTFIAGPKITPYLKGEWCAERFEQDMLRQFLALSVMPFARRRGMVSNG